MNTEEYARHAKRASIELGALDTETKKMALERIAHTLEKNRDKITAAHEKNIRSICGSITSKGLVEPCSSKLTYRHRYTIYYVAGLLSIACKG